jgi:hypothetical protein
MTINHNEIDLRLVPILVIEPNMPSIQEAPLFQAL